MFFSVFFQCFGLSEQRGKGAPRSFSQTLLLGGSVVVGGGDGGGMEEEEGGVSESWGSRGEGGGR